MLSDHPEGLSVSDLARELSTHRAGIYRLLGPLSDRRLVVRGEDARFRLGVGLIELAGSVRARLQEIAMPELQALADDVGATAALTIRDGEDAVVAAVCEPRNSDIHIAYRAGLRHRLDQAASGIAILAALPPRPGEREAVARARDTRLVAILRRATRGRGGRGRRSHSARGSRTGERQHRLDRRARRGRHGRARAPAASRIAAALRGGR